MDPTDVFTLDDVPDMPWGQVRHTAPPEDLEVYHLDSAPAAYAFAETHGVAFLALCVLYVVSDPEGTRFAVETVATNAQIVDQLAGVLAP